MILRASVQADAEAILALIRATPSLPQWQRESLALADSPAAIGNAPGLKRRLLVADVCGEIIGFAQSSLLLGEAELEAMAVRSDRRGSGVGRELLRQIIAELREEGAAVLRLEVRASNYAAIALYQSEGFSAMRTRPGYYREPVEDALVLQHTLGREPGCPGDASGIMQGGYGS